MSSENAFAGCLIFFKGSQQLLSLDDGLGPLGIPWGWETGPWEVWAVVPVHLCRLQNNMKFLLPGQLTTFAQVSKQMNK